MSNGTSDILEAFDIVHDGRELDEVQGDPIHVAKMKAKDAARLIGTPVIVEDVSLGFNAIGGMPGPYIKWFQDKLQCAGLWKLIEPYADRSGFALCIYAYAEDAESEPVLFVGRADGTIVAPRGDQKFGWDAIFQPVESPLTYAQLSADVKNDISPRARALKQLKEYLKGEAKKVLGQ